MNNTESWKYTNIKQWLERDYQTPAVYAPAITYGTPLPCPLPQAVEGKLEGNLLVIRVPQNMVLDKPIYITDLAVQLEVPTLLAAKHIIELGENSCATIVHAFVAEHADHYWRRHETEISLAANARLNYYQYQTESTTSLHTHTITVQQARDSRFESFTLDNGGGIVRTDLSAKLNGQQASCNYQGVYLVKEKQHVDNHTSIEHLSPHTYSEELYKGIVTDQARAVFNGRVYVAPEAQKVVSEQHNKNLLLSKTAEIDTKPELEIYADDVRCAHGATIGQLDRDAIFYLTARGIDEELAKQLLTYGFVHDMFGNILHEDIKPLFNQQLLDWFSAQHELAGLLT